jgi:hypothetical protein
MNGVKQELVEPEGKDLAKDLAALLRKIWGIWRKGCTGSLYRLILSEMMLEEEGARCLRDVFIPRRQAFTALAFQAAIERGEIPPETDIKLLLNFFYGYSVFRLMTRQIDDDPVIDHVCAAIAKLARSGVPSPATREKRSRIQQVA